MVSDNDRLVLEVRIGEEWHTSNRGKFYLFGLEIEGERYRDRHHKYTEGVAIANPGQIFTVWSSWSGSYPFKQDFYICEAGGGAQERILGGCYGKSGWCIGRFVILAHAEGQVKAPRLLEWVKEFGLENMTREVALEMGKQIAIPGRKKFFKEV